MVLIEVRVTEVWNPTLQILQQTVQTRQYFFALRSSSTRVLVSLLANDLVGTATECLLWNRAGPVASSVAFDSFDDQSPLCFPSEPAPVSFASSNIIITQTWWLAPASSLGFSCHLVTLRLRPTYPHNLLSGRSSQPRTPSD